MALEVSHNEASDADEYELAISDDICQLFEALGLPEPAPAPLMVLEYQVAQKLHAMSVPRSPGAHGLVDLQLIAANSQLDLPKVRQTCLHVFACRQMQPWPPTIEVGRQWEEAYAEAAQDCAVLPTVREAVTWANDFVARIDAASLSHT